MRFDLITALPGLVASPLAHSILQRAQTKGLVEVHVHDLRDYATDKHRQVDDYPFGGGAGMVLKAEPIFACYERLVDEATARGEAGPDAFVYLTPDGTTLTQDIASGFSLRRHVVLLAGHYKGVDQRVRDALVTHELSIGDYVLSGGELPALVLIDAVVRLLPGVLGDAESALSDSFMDGLLDAPAYTRPADFRGMPVPEVLLSGNHTKIAEWRDDERLQKTRLRRPDLLDPSQRPSHP